jgi:hypothetical protein
MPYCTQYPHPLWMNYIYYKPNEQYLHLMGLAHSMCCNPSLGLATKAKAYKSASQEGSPGITFHAPRNAKECEGMNPHTPKGTHTLGVGVSVDFQIFKEWL